MSSAAPDAGAAAGAPAGAPSAGPPASRLEPYDPQYEVHLPAPVEESLFAQIMEASQYCRTDGDPATAWVLQQYLSRLQAAPGDVPEDRRAAIATFAQRFEQYPGGPKVWYEFSRAMNTPGTAMPRAHLDQLLSQCIPPADEGDEGDDEEGGDQPPGGNHNNNHNNNNIGDDDDEAEETEEEFHAYLATLPADVQAIARGTAP